mmetsp:Transcript_59095/g.93583  ORF Transcript_59095/g.93583 Transcript_59095/m.93583 type:complete len:349 (-) Transcript_59095:1026-2072(-)
MVFEEIHSAADVTDVIRLHPQDPIQAIDVGVHVAARPVHVVQVDHLLLDQLDHHVNVLPMGADQLLLFSQDGADEPVVLPGQLVQGSLRVGERKARGNRILRNAEAGRSEADGRRGGGRGRCSQALRRAVGHQSATALQGRLHLLQLFLLHLQGRRGDLRRLRPRVRGVRVRVRLTPGAAEARLRGRLRRAAPRLRIILTVTAVHCQISLRGTHLQWLALQARGAGASWHVHRLAGRAAELLHAVGVPQGIQGVFHSTTAGRHIGDHHRSAVGAHEGILQDLCQLRSSEGRVVQLLVQRTDALLEGQQGLVDLGPVHACLAVGVQGIGTAFAASQVDETDLAVLLLGR